MNDFRGLCPLYLTLSITQDEPLVPIPRDVSGILETLLHSGSRRRGFMSLLVKVGNLFDYLSYVFFVCKPYPMLFQVVKRLNIGWVGTLVLEMTFLQ